MSPAPDQLTLFDLLDPLDWPVDVQECPDGTWCATTPGLPGIPMFGTTRERAVHRLLRLADAIRNDPAGNWLILEQDGDACPPSCPST